VPGKIFISHEEASTRQAVEFKELLEQASSGVQIFLTSDWDSLPSGQLAAGVIVLRLDSGMENVLQLYPLLLSNVAVNFIRQLVAYRLQGFIKAFKRWFFQFPT
jgi:hypothetical protein